MNVAWNPENDVTVPPDALRHALSKFATGVTVSNDKHTGWTGWYYCEQFQFGLA